MADGGSTASTTSEPAGASAWWRATGLRWAAGVGLFAVAVALPLLRQRGSRSWATIWAEDGAVYSSQAVFDGSLEVLFRSYNGYLQFPPRLLSVAVPLVPTEQLSRYLSLSAAVYTALLAWFVFWATDRWVSSVPVRLALASLPVLMPVLGDEITANVTNTIWPTLAVLPWALLSTRDRPRDVAVCSTVAILAALSSALAVMYAPLALAVAALRRRVSTWVTAGAFCLGLGIQGLVILSAPEGPERQANDVGDLVYQLSTRVFGVFLVGYEGIQDVWEANAVVATVGVTLVVAALFAVVFPGAGWRAQKVGLVLLAYALISFVFPVAGRGTDAISDVSLDPGIGGSRFSVLPVFLLASAFAVLVAPTGAGRERTLARIGRPVLVAQIALLALLEFSVTNARSDAPPVAELADEVYAEECVDAPPGAVVAIPISPAPWGYPVSCDRLD